MLHLKNMKKMIPNPAYANARYNLGWLALGRIGPQAEPAPRSNLPPPVGKTLDEWKDWIAKNAIYPTIEVDEP